MPVSQSAPSSSINLSALPAGVAEALAGLVAVCREPRASDPLAAAFEEAELRIRASVNALGCAVPGAWVEGLDDGPLRVERAGRRWFRVAATAKTIMTTLGPVRYRRARYRHGASRTSVVPVDESPGLVNDYLTRPAGRLGPMMMGHGTAREAETFFSETGAMTPSASTLQRLAQSLHERWGSLGPRAMEDIRNAETIPPEAASASVSLLRLRGGRLASWWRCGPVRTAAPKPAGARPPAARSPSSTAGPAPAKAGRERLKTLYLARVPESGKPTLKAQLASDVAHIRQVRPDIAVTAVADGAADNWTFLENPSPEAQTVDFWHACEHLRAASHHAADPRWFETCRHILRHNPPRAGVRRRPATENPADFAHSSVNHRNRSL